MINCYPFVAEIDCSIVEIGSDYMFKNMQFDIGPLNYCKHLIFAVSNFRGLMEVAVFENGPIRYNKGIKRTIFLYNEEVRFQMKEIIFHRIIHSCQRSQTLARNISY